MPSEKEPLPASKAMFWAGWIVTVLPVLMLLLSGIMKLVRPEPVVEGFKSLGYSESLALPAGGIACSRGAD